MTPDSPELVWEAPSPQPRPTIYDKVLKQVKARPGQWARIRSELSQGTAYSARAHLARRLAGDEAWEVIVRPHGDFHDLRALYIRYRTPDQIEAAKTKKEN